MGHKRIGALPKTKAWRLIVEELGAFVEDNSNISSIAKNTLKKVQKRYGDLENDPSVQSTFEYLIKLSHAFQKDNPVEYLKNNHILDTDELSVFRLANGITRYKNTGVSSHEYEVFAKQAAIDAVNKWYLNNLEHGKSFFHTGIDTVSVFHKASSGSGFCELSRLFFSKFTERYLKYFLEREASARIPGLNERKRFNEEVEKHVNEISKHAFETSKITQSYSAGWFNKNVKQVMPGEKEIKNFISVSFKKMKKELLREEMN